MMHIELWYVWKWLLDIKIAPVGQLCWLAPAHKIFYSDFAMCNHGNDLFCSSLFWWSAKTNWWTSREVWTSGNLLKSEMGNVSKFSLVSKQCIRCLYWVGISMYAGCCYQELMRAKGPKECPMANYALGSVAAVIPYTANLGIPHTYRHLCNVTWLLCNIILYPYHIW